MKSLANPYSFFMGIRAQYELEEQLRALASKIPVAIAVHIHLCRDKRRTVRLILKPPSIMILGGRKRWWSVEQKLARVLKKDGHHVIFAESR
jgi:hypothetical protein